MEIFDQLGILSQADIQRLQTTAWPFTVHLYIVRPISEANLTETVKQAITPNSVGIGIDMHNHRVALRASGDMDISMSTLVSIRKTGNPFFKHGDIVGGVNALLSSTMAERTTAQAPVPAPYVPAPAPYRAPVQTTPIVQHTERPVTPAASDSGFSFFPWFLLAVVAVGVFFVIRRNRQMQAQLQQTYIEPPRAPSPPDIVQPRIPSITQPYTPTVRRSSIPTPPSVNITSPSAPRQADIVRATYSKKDDTKPYSVKELKRREPTIGYDSRKKIDTPDSGFVPFTAGVVTGAVVGSILSDDDGAKASSWDNDDPTPSVGSTDSWDTSDSTGDTGSWDD